MKTTYFIILSLIFSYTTSGQVHSNLIDSLVNQRNISSEALNLEIKYFENMLDSLRAYDHSQTQKFNNKIDSIKKEHVSSNTLKIKIKSAGKAVVYENKSSYSNELIRLENGTELLLLEIVNSLFYKVDYNGIIGYLQIEDTIDGKGSTSTKSTSSSYSSRKRNYSNSSTTKSTQCTGRTQEGSRCKNSTKSYSSRCHLHD
mgnify:CR=1 FL=1